MLAELERLRSLPDPVVVAQQQREEQLVDMQKFEQLIQNLQVGREGTAGGRRGGGGRRDRVVGWHWSLVVWTSFAAVTRPASLVTCRLWYQDGRREVGQAQRIGEGIACTIPIRLSPMRVLTVTWCEPVRHLCPSPCRA